MDKPIDTHFQPKLFFEEVSKSVEIELETSVQRLQQEIVKLVQQKNLQNVSTEEVQKGCELLLQKMKIVYNRNIEKFKIYSTKNLFVAEANSNDSTNSSSKNGSVVSDEISVKVPKDLLMLRQKYASISSEYLALVSECELMDKLLKDMRSALFTLRVGAQTFEEYGVQPIEETLASMSQQKSHLNELCKEASGMIQQLEKIASKRKRIEEPVGKSSQSIEVDSTEDLDLLAKSLKPTSSN